WGSRHIDNVKYDCEPGTSWRTNCNSCVCTESGRAICTLKACFPPYKTDALIERR
ncbi:hypothetical protein L9F63_006168, partial [Diploptera punctata]